MKSRLVSWAFAIICLLACQNNEINPYKNKFNIPPAVVAQLDTPNYSTIAWLDTVQNFGTIKEGESVPIKYRFKNSGEKPLFISEVRPSCGCTVTDYPKNIIFPEKGGELTATFNSHDMHGFVQKSVWVVSNTSNGVAQLLKFSGQVSDSSDSKK